MEPLITERLLLRPFSSEDAKDIFELNGDPEVMKYTGDQPFGSIAEARKFILSYNHFEKWERGRFGVFFVKTMLLLDGAALNIMKIPGRQIWGIDLKILLGKRIWH